MNAAIAFFTKSYLVSTPGKIIGQQVLAHLAARTTLTNFTLFLLILFRGWGLANPTILGRPLHHPSFSPSPRTSSKRREYERKGKSKG